jgi:TatD DNase family protein
MMTLKPYIDFHTHSEWNGPSTLEVVSMDANNLKNVTYYTIGYHPWWVTEKLNDTGIQLLADHYTQVSHCLGIGECGLDSLKGISIARQEEVFIQQIELANALNCPLVVHCVRAYDRIMHLKKKLGQTPWVVHGYKRNKVLAFQLLDAGFYLSIAPTPDMPMGFIEMAKSLPPDRFFMETDSDFRWNIEERYGLMAVWKNLPVEMIREIIYNNFITFYKNKWKYPLG